MKANNHFIFGLTVGTMFAINIDKISTILPNIENTENAAMLFAIGGVCGCNVPDMDSSTSFIAKMTKPISTVFCKMGRNLGKTGNEHRGILHDPIWYIAGLICSYLYAPSLVGFFIGCLSHILLDMYNPSGIPFLFGAKRLHLGSIPADSKQATKFTALATAVFIVLGIAVKALSLTAVI